MPKFKIEINTKYYGREYNIRSRNSTSTKKKNLRGVNKIFNKTVPL